MENNNYLFPRMHVSLYVSDIQATVDFYTIFFGTEPVKLKNDYAKYILEKPSLIISFVENKERVQSNFGHLGFQVETEYELNKKMELADRFKLISKIEEGVNCCYAKQDKFWVKDPDGVQWEVYYFHEDAEFNDPFYTQSEAEACCTSKNILEVAKETGCCTPVDTKVKIKEAASACC